MKDLKLNNDFDLDFANGDLVLGESSEQNVKLILIYTPGSLKKNPLVGCSLIKAKYGTVSRFMQNTIRQQLLGDGFKIKKIKIHSLGIDINGNY
ncbi:MAG: hypothetical protein ACPGSD_07685 [Flavobacteriales bacterium]